MFECASRDLRRGCTAVHFSWLQFQFLGHVLVKSLEGEAHYFYKEELVCTLCKNFGISDR